MGGTPPFDVAFIEGNVGSRRHSEGHTATPDWPTFVQMASRYFDDARPTMEPGQRLLLHPQAVGTVGTIRASDADGD